jgi:hypothetical protein
MGRRSRVGGVLAVAILGLWAVSAEATQSSTAIFHLAGFDATTGTFNFSTNGSGGTFSFSASNGATPVTEPASLVILGSGMLFGAGSLRRRWHARTASRATRTHQGMVL